MKKADRISRIISLKTVCCFQYFIVSGGEVPPKSAKNIFDKRLELLPNRVLRKFESYMQAKIAVWYLRKNLVLFGPPDMQKTQEFPGFFGQGSFFALPIWKGRAKKMPPVMGTKGPFLVFVLSIRIPEK